MLGIRYLKVPATTYVLQFKAGKVVKQGPGLSFFYFAPTSVIAQVPISSVDVRLPLQRPLPTSRT